MNILKKIFFVFSFISLVLLGGHLFFNFALFPNEIHLIVGKEQSFDFNVPVAATISKSGQNIKNITVNNCLVESEMDIDLSEPFFVYADDVSEIDMTLSFMGIPVKNVTVSVLPETEVVPCGKTVGVRIDTDGIIVLGLGSVDGENGNVYEPCGGILRAGDIILSVDGKVLSNKEELISYIENSFGRKIHFIIRRGGKSINADVIPVKDKNDGKYKVGIWVRDSTQGIGTITYYDDKTNSFAALGHGIADIDTKQIMEVKSGSIMKANVVSVKRGQKGSPGELIGNIEKSSVIGSIIKNTNCGIFGYITDEVNKNSDFVGTPIPIALQSEVKEGPAVILSNIDGSEVKQYNVLIEEVNRYGYDSLKSMIVKITDEELLKKTNGIVQGMSGSPIIQNGKLIGAVTHVFVQEPSKGYGIFIENMIRGSRE